MEGGRRNFTKNPVSKQTVFIALLLALILTGGLATVSAEEVVGTILFEPTKNTIQGGWVSPIWTYMVDSMGNSLSNRRLIATTEGSGPNVVFDTLTQYLQPGQKLIFESNGKNHFETIYLDEIIAFILPDGQSVELTEMFSANDIKLYLGSLQRKLVREGRAR